MTNEEILEKAFKKAFKNGFRDLHENRLAYDLIVNIPRRYGVNTTNELVIRGLIFSHSFAKAFWGEPIDHEFSSITNLCVKCGLDAAEWGGSYCGEGWQFHLQQMVLEEDPIKYLERFV